MGYIVGHGRFSFESGTEEPLTAERFSDALAFVEYPYNIFACQSWYADGNTFNVSKIERALLSRGLSGIAHANCMLRSLFPTDAGLTLVNLNMRSPILGEVKGIAEAIRALVDLLDPLKWKDKWEDLRHKRVMNRYEEAQKFRDSLVDSYESRQKIVASMTNMQVLLKRFEEAFQGRGKDANEAHALGDLMTREELETLLMARVIGINIKSLPE